jgi:hypothetical protein
MPNHEHCPSACPCSAALRCHTIASFKSSLTPSPFYISPEWIERKGMEERAQCKQSIREGNLFRSTTSANRWPMQLHTNRRNSPSVPDTITKRNTPQQDHRHSSATPSRWNKTHKRRHFVTLSDPNSDGQWTDTSQSIGNGKDHTGASTEWHQQVITRSLRRQALSPSSRVGARQDLQKIFADACVQKVQTSVHRGEGPP